MVLPVMPIAKLHTDNKGLPIGVIWQSTADRVFSSATSPSMPATCQKAWLVRVRRRGGAALTRTMAAR
jgi:hypothetical protein